MDEGPGAEVGEDPARDSVRSVAAVLHLRARECDDEELNEKAKELLYHPNRERIKLARETATLDGKRVYFSGILPALQRRFWPWRGSDPPWAEQKRRASRASFKPRSLERSCQTSGMAHGIIVHDELCACVRAISIGRPHDLVGDQWDPCTVHLLQLMRGRGWIPLTHPHLLGEFPVFSERLRMRSSVDLIFANPARGTLGVAEVKTGYEDEEYEAIESDPHLLGALGGLRDCPDVRHQLQLMTTILLLEECYGVRIEEAYVLLACSKRRGVAVVRRPKWAEDRENFRILARALLLPR